MQQQQDESVSATVAASRDSTHRESAANNETNIERREEVSFKEIDYGMNSYYAVVRPVFVTMVLAAITVLYVRTEQSAAAAEANLSNAYKVYQTNEDDTTGTQLGHSLVNGLVMIAAICVLTFVIVLFYKYRCMKCLLGYMILSSTMLLGFLASAIFRVAIERYSLKIDKVSFYLFMYNFAVTGVVAIFVGQPAAPAYISQLYLVLTSVIVAWQLSHFDAWTAWVLLVLLACYDLFAVLTPCGPLKALVKLMQRDDAPSMPGLLYEASLPQPQTNNEEHANGSSRNESENRENVAMPLLQSNAMIVEPCSQTESESTLHSEADEHLVRNDDDDAPNGLSREVAVATSIEEASGSARTESGSPESAVEGSSVVGNDDEETIPSERTGRIPRALARKYNLPLVNDPNPPWRREEVEAPYSAEQLRELVLALFPEGGGRIVPSVTLDPNLYSHDDADTRYTVVDHQGNPKRVVFVNREGRLFEDLREERADADAKDRTSIKLGLGDFIFYSILVSKAALYSYTTFAVCTLSILSGLGMTLLLLAMYGKALPALPISIFLGVIYYLFTRFVMEPWVEAIFIHEVYV